jgi:hypothetical protein
MRLAHKLLLGVGIVLTAFACNQEQKVEYADEAGDTSSEKPKAPARRSFGFEVTVDNQSLNLATATEYEIQLTSCASTQAVTIDESKAYLELYEFDRNCLAKLNRFKLIDKIYTPKAGSLFDTWIAGDVATFEVVGATPPDELRVEVLETIANPVVANGSIHYQFSEIVKGTDQNVAEAAVRESASITVSGQDAPQFTVKNIYFVGVTATGNGEFRFQLECDADLTGAAGNRKCVDVRLDSIEMVLVKDTYGGTLDQTDLDAIWVAESPKQIDMATEAFSPNTGAPVLPHGGFITANTADADVMVMSGNKPVASNRAMVFILKSGPSYTYYTIDVAAITQDDDH